MIGIYNEIELDPVSTIDFDFVVEFNLDYSTACMEKVECFKCDRNEAGCDTFFEDKKSALASVSITLLTSI